MERAHSVIDQLTLKEGDLHKLAKDTEDAEAAGLRRIFDDVVPRAQQLPCANLNDADESDDQKSNGVDTVSLGRPARAGARLAAHITWLMFPDMLT